MSCYTVLYRFGPDWLTFRNGRRGIFNIHQLMLADRTPGLPSIRGTAHFVMKHRAYGRTDPAIQGRVGI